MALYILRRLGGLLLSLAVLSVIVFSLMHVAPGGPFSYDQNMPDYMMANIAHKYGLDRPVYEQYINWVAAMLHGDFGIPYQSPTETVVQVVLRAWPITLIIGAISIAFAFGCRHAPGHHRGVQPEQLDRQPRDLRGDARAWRCRATSSGSS